MKRILPLLILFLLTMANADFYAQTVSGTAGKKSHDHGSQGDARRFVGYWMGIDPLDGGDSRRGITRNEDGTFSLILRDTVFTLCDNTDRALGTFSDGVIDHSALTSDNLVIKCFNTGATVTLKYHSEFIDKNILRETVTQQDGTPVDEIIFHRVGQQ